MFLTILAQKGEQTKTSTAVNLAAAFAVNRPGVIVDTDIQQSDATKYRGSILGIDWVKEMPKKARVGEFVIVDTPPQIVDATGVALSRSDLAIIPCTPRGPSLESLARTFETIEIARRINPKLVALVAFTCVDRSQYAQGVIAAAKVLSQWPVAGTQIPVRVMDFEKAFAARRPVVLNAPKSAAAAAYRALAAEIVAGLEA